MRSTDSFRGVLVCALLAAVVVSGCSSDNLAAGLDPDGQYFEGLDPLVVDEVLADPYRLDALLYLVPEDDREGQAQVMVVNTILCRDGYQYYQEWTTTGVAPEIPELAKPTNPDDDFYPLVVQITYADFVDTIESGDPEELRIWLAETDSCCGQFVPVIPGDWEGLSISEALNGLPRAERISEDE